LCGGATRLSQRDEYRSADLLRREQEIHVHNGEACFKREKFPTYTHCRAESDMAECLQGLTIALLAADGVGQIELEASVDALRDAGAQTQLLSLRTGHIESLDKDFGPGSTFTVDQTLARATVDEYHALLLVPGTVKSDRLSSDDLVVSFVRDFITSGKPVGIVCHGAWTLLEGGTARGQSLPLSLTMRAQRKTGASLLEVDLVSPRAQRAFYGTIVEEFARLIPQAWARVAVSPPWPGPEKYSAAKKVAGS
jgi:protease I